ncbi:lytic transglycosylase domain-containing protein [bacterium]|nr:lytic transglycosylase domain-containing protein [bacterium]
MVVMQRYCTKKIAISFVVLAALLLVGVCQVNADIFMYKDSNGILHLGNKPEARKKGKLFMKESPRYFPPVSRKKQEIVDLIERVAKKHNVDPDLAKAIARAESSFRPDAVSPKGAVGVMQLMPGTAKRFNVKNVYHPEDNIDAGIRYLKILLGMFPKDMKLAIAAYNAGENRVIRCGNTIPNIKETREYVDRVIRFYDAYRGKKTKKQKTNVLSRPVRKKTLKDGTIVLSNL